MTDSTDPRLLVEALRKDVFYGDERMHKFNQHNPLHMRAADALTAALDRAEKAEAENKRLTLAVSYANLNADTAWNDAIEVAESRADNILQGYAIEKGNTKTPGGRTANFYRRKVKEAVVTLKKGAKP